MDYEKLGLFYLGRPYDLAAKAGEDGLVLYDSRDLVTHAVCVGMTGSGKTGLCIGAARGGGDRRRPGARDRSERRPRQPAADVPEPAPAEFRPWIDEDDARRQGMDRRTSSPPRRQTRGQTGLAEWGQDGARIRRLRDAADVAIYTPGSQAGMPLSVLQLVRGAAAGDPRRRRADARAREHHGDEPARPARHRCRSDQSREHILLSTLLDAAWREGQDLDIAALIQQIQSPPVTQVGVLELEAFYPGEGAVRAGDGAQQPARRARVQRVDGGRAARRPAPAATRPRASRAWRSSRSRT